MRVAGLPYVSDANMILSSMPTVDHHRDGCRRDLHAQAIGSLSKTERQPVYLPMKTTGTWLNTRWSNSGFKWSEPVSPFPPVPFHLWTCYSTNRKSPQARLLSRL